LYCNGADSNILAARKCTVPLSEFTSAPYNLILGQPINVKVTASNNYGTSALSTVGNGAVI